MEHKTVLVLQLQHQHNNANLTKMTVFYLNQIFFG